MWRAWSLAVLVVLAVLAAPAESLARVPTRLVYARAPSAKECPDESALTAAVAARLGYDPFSPWGDQTILATISRTNTGLIGQAQLVDHDGIAQGSREVKLPQGDCGELILALALAISITLDPLHVDAPPPAEPEPLAEPTVVANAEVPADTNTSAAMAAEPPAPAVQRDAPVQRARQPSVGTAWHAQAGVLSAIGLAPDVTLGGRLGLEGRRGRWSLALEAWMVLPRTSDLAGGGRLETSLLTAALAPCFELMQHTRLCALGSLGSLAVEAHEVDVPRSQRVLHAAAGARAGVAWPLGTRLTLLANADLLATLNRPRFQLDGEDVWRPGPLLTVIGIGASVRFF